MNTTKSMYLLKNSQVVQNILSLFIVLTIGFLAAQNAKKQNPILIQGQGSFAIGGTVITFLIHSIRPILLRPDRPFMATMPK